MPWASVAGMGAGGLASGDLMAGAFPSIADRRRQIEQQEIEELLYELTGGDYGGAGGMLEPELAAFEAPGAMDGMMDSVKDAFADPGAMGAITAAANLALSPPTTPEGAMGSLGGTVGGIAGQAIDIPLVGPAIGSAAGQTVGRGVGGLFGGGAEEEEGMEQMRREQALQQMMQQLSGVGQTLGGMGHSMYQSNLGRHQAMGQAMAGIGGMR